MRADRPYKRPAAPVTDATVQLTECDSAAHTGQRDHVCSAAGHRKRPVTCRGTAVMGDFWAICGNQHIIVEAVIQPLPQRLEAYPTGVVVLARHERFDDHAGIRHHGGAGRKMTGGFRHEDDIRAGEDALGGITKTSGWGRVWDRPASDHHVLEQRPRAVGELRTQRLDEVVQDRLVIVVDGWQTMERPIKKFLAGLATLPAREEREVRDGLLPGNNGKGHRSLLGGAGSGAHHTTEQQVHTRLAKQCCDRQRDRWQIRVSFLGQACVSFLPSRDS